MRWLITGADGFVGNHLLPYLLEVENESEIWALVWNQAPTKSRPKSNSRLHVVPVEITEAEEVRKIVTAAQPEIILHLAAASSVAQSWSDPTPAYQINVLGQLNILEAARQLPSPPRVVIASSSDIYGRDQHEGRPISEKAALRPVSPYAVTKSAQDLQAFQYFSAHGLATIRLRLFHHTGPGRPSEFVGSSFAYQIAEIEKGVREPIMKVGDLSVARDFSDVRDVVRAWWLAALHGAPGEAYNICSGRPVAIRHLLDTLLGFSRKEIEVKTDSTLLRKGEIKVLFGDPTLFNSATGWQPEIPLEQTLADILEYWRAHV